MTRHTENFEMHKKVAKEVKKVVSDSKSKSYDDLYNKLGTRGGKTYFQACKNEINKKWELRSSQIIIEMHKKVAKEVKKVVND